MHIVTSRPLTPGDAKVGTRILMRHGVGYVPGEIVSVNRKERPGSAQTLGYPHVQIHFGVRSDTGFETGSSFGVDGVDFGTRFLVADPEVDPEDAIDAEVLDYIGCTVTYVGTSFFYRGNYDPEDVAKKFRAAVEEAGFEVFGTVAARPVTEQKVVVYNGYGEDRRASAAVYEFAANSVPGGTGGVITFDYLPVGS